MAAPTAMATAATLRQQRVRCGGMESVDGGHLSPLLPPRAISRTDEHGPGKETECRVDHEGNKAKAAASNRVRKIARPPLSGCAIESRSCPKLGKSVKEDVDSHMIPTKEVTVEHPRDQGRKAGGPAASGDPHARRKVVKVYKTCGKKGDHWSSKCQSEGLAPRTDAFVDCSTADGSATPDVAVKGAYVLPTSDRSVPRGMGSRNDDAVVRVSNLSKETREPDLYNLFCPFGLISRAHVALDEKTGSCRGFGFVKFVVRQEAERAIRIIEGYYYDDLPIHVEWAKC